MPEKTKHKWIESNKPPFGVQIGGIIYPDGKPVGTDEFTDAFIEWVESREWMFGGVTRPVDEDGKRVGIPTQAGFDDSEDEDA